MARKQRAKTLKLKKKKKNWLYYLNYKNLSAEIQQYGYVFSPHKVVLASILEILLAIVFGLVFQLGIPFITTIALAGLVMVPQLIVHNYYNMYQQKRFSDANMYMEQLLYSFNKKKNILDSLRDVQTIFEEGPMKDLLTGAIKNIQYSYAEKDIEAESLSYIEKEYKNRRLKRINSFILKTRTYGGDISNSTQVLLQDRAMWETRTIEYQNRRKFVRNSVAICLILTVLTCAVPLFFLQKRLNIAVTPISQVSSTILILLCMFIYTKADQYMTIDWLDSEREVDPKELESYYPRYVNYNVKDEFVKSLKHLIIPVIFGLFGVYLVHTRGTGSMIAKVYFIIAILGAVYVLFSCYIGEKNLYNALVKEVNMAFPEWLTEIAILMQTENIQNSIRKSYDTAPPVLKTSIKQLLDELEYKPMEVEPYANFMKELHLCEVDKAMKLLYSFSEGKAGDKSEQVKTILQTNATLMDKSERIKNKELIARYERYEVYPMMIGALKMITDMIALTQVFFQFSQSIF